MACSKLNITSAALAACTILTPAAPAIAQSWPTKPIRFIVPYTPGGIIDAAARVIGPKLTEAWGQQVIIENKPGGNAFIGTQFVVKSPPDGYTYVLATLGDFTVNPSLFKDIPYSVERDLAPVSMLTSIPTVLAVHAGTSYKSMADVIADAKTQPGKLSYSTPGNGAINHIAMEAMALITGTKFQHIPYKGGAPATTAVAAGDVPLGMLGFTATIPFLKSEKIRVLATATSKRLEAYPQWPTLQELGMANFDGSNWVGLMAPAKTPDEIIEKMNAEIAKVLAMPDVRERLAGTGGTPIPGPVAQFRQRLITETAAFKDVVEKAGIQPQ